MCSHYFFRCYNYCRVHLDDEGSSCTHHVILGGNGEFTIVTMLATSNYAVRICSVCRYVPINLIVNLIEFMLI